MGTSRERAAQLCGVSPEAVRLWFRRGERDIKDGATETVHAEFVVQMVEAESHVISLLEGSVVHAALNRRDWRAASWMLSKKRPDEYGDNQKLILVVQGELQKIMDQILDKVSAGAGEEMLDALSDIHGVVDPMGSGEAPKTLN
jgi:hypothetical protein